MIYPEFGPAVLAYVRDAVVADVEHRRRAAALQRRAAELEAVTEQRYGPGEYRNNRERDGEV